MRLTPVEIAMREKMDAFIEASVREKQFRGSVLVVRHGNPTPLLSKGYGKANEEGGLNTPQTIFPLASLSKQFTAVALLLLRQKDPQNIILSNTVNHYLPKKFRSPLWSKVTLHQLLNHTAGLDTYGRERENKDKLYTAADLVKLCRNKPLQFKPGSGWNYSNYGYALLGAVIEHVSGLSYGEFLKTEIFERWGMDSTGFGNTYNKNLIATGYTLKRSSKKALTPLISGRSNLSKAYSAGGLYSTVEDLQKWDRALYDDSFLSSESRTLLFNSEPHILKIIGDTESFFEMYRLPELKKAKVKAPQLLYGYGFIIQKESYGHIVFHKGRIKGFRTMILRNLDTKDCLIILSNNEEFDPYLISGYLTKIVYSSV